MIIILLIGGTPTEQNNGVRDGDGSGDGDGDGDGDVVMVMVIMVSRIR